MKNINFFSLAIALSMIFAANQSMGQNQHGFNTLEVDNKVIQDTSGTNHIMLPEVAVAGVRNIQAIGLSKLKPDSGYRGETGDRIAVYIPYPASNASYQVTNVTLTIKNPHQHFHEKFEEGELHIKLCKATDVSHPPLDSALSPEIIIYPDMVSKARETTLEIPLAKPVKLPSTGLYIVAAWQYKRNSKDAISRKIRSADLAASYALAQSYTWTSIGDLKQTWQREGEKNSVTEITQRQGLHPQWKGKIYNSMMGVKVKQVE